MNGMEKPYIISEELDLLNDGYIQRDVLNAFRENLDEDLRALGKNTLWIASQEIQKGITLRTNQTKSPTVSLDDRYTTSADEWLGVSRGINEDLNDIGYVPRVGYPALDTQLDAVAKTGEEIVLIDDVVFSGDMITWLDAELRKRNTKIASVICGIAIGKGIQKLNEQGIDVDAVRVFDDIDDELCERDFAVVAGSGRRIEAAASNALYFSDQYGKPAEWASIPKGSIVDFTARSFRRSASLLDPSIPMKGIGSFYGINSNVNAVDVLLQKAAEAEKRI